MIHLIAMLLTATPEETPELPPDDTYLKRHHFDVSMGFTGSVRDLALDRAAVYGLAWETRFVTQHVRFTIGLQKPFASMPANPSLWDIRFGLGTEYSFRYVTPYVDVIGDVQKIDAAWTFGFVARVGLRVHMGESLFLAPAGEIGLGGPVRWGVGLQAGWVLPVG
jgi:hypothetical protein